MFDSTIPIVSKGNLRFKGCQCTGSGLCEVADNCPCVNARRECDPELCITCDARYVIEFLKAWHPVMVISIDIRKESVGLMGEVYVLNEVIGSSRRICQNTALQRARFPVCDDSSRLSCPSLDFFPLV